MERQVLKDYLLNKYGLTFHKSTVDPLNLQIVEVTAHNPFIILSTSTPQLDVKCPNFAATIQNLPGFTEPRLMNHPEWVGIQLDQIKAQDLFNILDYAFKSATNGNQNFIAQQLGICQAMVLIQSINLNLFRNVNSSRKSTDFPSH